MCISFSNISAIGTLVATIAIAIFGYLQWQVSERNRRSQQFQRYIENYLKLIKALQLFIHGNKDEQGQGFRQIREGYDEARLCLSKDVIKLIEHVIEKINKIDNWRQV